jgi:hypothetical protein
LKDHPFQLLDDLLELTYLKDENLKNLPRQLEVIAPIHPCTKVMALIKMYRLLFKPLKIE